MAVSDAVHIKFDRNWDIDIDESKNIIVQVSMDDKEHKGSQLVVIRYLLICQTLSYSSAQI